MFPKNAWYVACTPDEIEGKPLGRRICGESIAFFRGPQNLVAAVDDFCPHRGAPLSLGTVKDGVLVCGYHGLMMGCEGKVISMPGQRVRGFAPIRSYPVQERYGFVWVWPGDPALADADEIQAPIWHGKKDWAYGGGLFHMNCDFRLLIDNLMDLTHETYVHSTSIGQQEIDETPVKTSVEEGIVVTARYMENIKAPPFWQAAMLANNLDARASVDRWQVCRFLPPSNVLIDVGVALCGKGGINAPANDKVLSVVVDYITPETETSCWYFWGMARHFQADDAALTDTIRKGQGAIFAEDQEILERQQQNITRNPSRRLMMLNIDAGGVQARRMIDRLIAAEQTAEQSH